MNTKELKDLLAALRYAQEKCEAVLAGEVSHDSPVAELAVSLAYLFKQGGNDRPLREWFRAVEEQTVRELIKNGADSGDIARYMGTSKEAVRQYFHRCGFTIAGCREE